MAKVANPSISAIDQAIARLRPAITADLSIRQVALMLHVAGHPGEPATFGSVSAATGLPSKPAVTRAAQRLQAEGLIKVVTDPADGRRVLLSPTPNGIRLVARIVGETA